MKIIDKFKNPSITIKESINKNDYDSIKNLEKLCVEADQISFKLELDYKLNYIESKEDIIDNFNEFMFYDGNILIGYIGICDFGHDSIEVNGMIHPEYRKKGIFTKLFSLVNDEFNKRDAQTMLLLSDNKSVSGIQFIKKVCDDYDHSEYDMNLNMDAELRLKLNNIILRRAVIEDANEIAKMDSVFFNIEVNSDDTFVVENLVNGTTNIAELNNDKIGKVRIEINDGIGGIYGFGVLPEYRKNGYGREILTMAIEKLKEMNAEQITLQVETRNSNALNLYKSCGFEENYVMDYYKKAKVN